MGISYKSSGVDIDAGNEAVGRIKTYVQGTFDDNVVTGIGTFGAMYDLSIIKSYEEPILVQSIDGVGTKLKVGKMMSKYEGLGEDIVNHCCNDVVCQGARPLTFLDYIASDHLDPDIVEAVVAGMAKACREAGVSLIGGETAEMPGVYAQGEHDIAGCISGIVEKEDIITGKDITVGDVLIGLPSTGLHTNGFSLARKIFFEDHKYKASDMVAELQSTIGDVLLVPHRNYSPLILKLLSNFNIKGIAHITGGGLVDNIPRILSDGLGVEINKGSWPVLPIFDFMQKLGEVEEQEMYRTFNMGIGMVLVVSAKDKVSINKRVNEFSGYKLYEIGRVVAGKKEIKLI